MRFGTLLCVVLGGVFTLSGCDSSKVDEKDISDQKARISELEKDLQAAKEEKQKAIDNASDESRQEAEEKITDLEAKLQEERDQLAAMQDRYKFENQMVNNLEEMDANIDTLEEQADEATGDREVELRKRIAALKTRREQLRDKLTDLRAASGNEWATLKNETEEAWNEASTSVKDAMQDVKQNVDEKVNEDETPELENTESTDENL